MWCQPVLAQGSQLPPGWLCFAHEDGLQQQSWSPWRSSCVQQANKAEHAGGGVASPWLLASSTLLAWSGGRNSGILSHDGVSDTYCGAEIAAGALAEVLRNINYPNSLGLQLSWQSYEHVCLVSSQLQWHKDTAVTQGRSCASLQPADFKAAVLRRQVKNRFPK